MVFLVGKIVGSLLMPPGLFVLLALAALWPVFAGRRKAAISVLTVSVIATLILSLNPVADAFISPLESEYPPLTASAARSVDVPIVVLGGGFLRRDPGGDGYGSLRPDSLARAVYGAALARDGTGELCFTGSSLVHDARGGTEADAAARLWEGLGIAASRIRLEKQSLDTMDNALFVKKIVGTGPIVLVTSAWHMPRAMVAFRKAGIKAIAAPCSYRGEGGGYDFTDWLPSSGALQTSAWAIHEYVGLAWYNLIPSKH